MTVNPGFGGQSYIPAMTEKIRTLRHILEEKGLQTDIEIDGGVDTKNLRMVIEGRCQCACIRFEDFWRRYR